MTTLEQLESHADRLTGHRGIHQLTITNDLPPDVVRAYAAIERCAL